MTAWWRRNRWYLLALAVLVPIAVVVALEPRFFPYLEAQQPRISAVERGETGAYGGAEFRLVDLEVFDGERVGAPAGGDVVLATVAVLIIEPSDNACRAYVVATDGPVERRWELEPYLRSDIELGDADVSRCFLDTAGASEARFLFLVPSGTADRDGTGLEIEISASTERPRVLRLR